MPAERKLAARQVALALLAAIAFLSNAELLWFALSASNSAVDLVTAYEPPVRQPEAAPSAARRGWVYL